MKNKLFKLFVRITLYNENGIMKRLEDIPGYKPPEFKMINIPLWGNEDSVKVITISYEQHYNLHNLFCFIKYYFKKITHQS